MVAANNLQARLRGSGRPKRPKGSTATRFCLAIKILYHEIVIFIGRIPITITQTYTLAKAGGL